MEPGPTAPKSSLQAATEARSLATEIVDTTRASQIEEKGNEACTPPPGGAELCMTHDSARARTSHLMWGWWPGGLTRSIACFSRQDSSSRQGRQWQGQIRNDAWLAGDQALHGDGGVPAHADLSSPHLTSAAILVLHQRDPPPTKVSPAPRIILDGRCAGWLGGNGRREPSRWSASTPSPSMQWWPIGSAG